MWGSGPVPPAPAPRSTSFPSDRHLNPEEFPSLAATATAPVRKESEKKPGKEPAQVCAAAYATYAQQSWPLLTSYCTCRNSRAGLTTRGMSLTGGMAIPTGELLLLSQLLKQAHINVFSYTTFD